jgi:hypothetical protein
VSGAAGSSDAGIPGKRTLADGLQLRTSRDLAAGEPVQQDSGAVQQVAAQGISGGADRLPHSDIIQRAFGRHDVSAVQAHIGGEAETASRAIGLDEVKPPAPARGGRR